MNTISKNIYSLLLKGKNLNNITIAATIACIAFVVIVVIKKIRSVKEDLLEAIKILNKNKSSRTDDPSFDNNSVGEYKFPVENDNYKDVISYLTKCRGFTYFSKSDRCKELGTRSITRDSIISLVYSHVFSIEGQDLTVLTADGIVGQEVLAGERIGSIHAQSFIEDRSLKNIEIVPRILHNDIGEDKDLSILIRKSPDMKADRAARKRGILKNRGKCKIAAESLAELAGEFIFTVPDNPKFATSTFISRHDKSFEDYKDLRDYFDKSDSIDTSEYNFTAERLLGEDSFTISEDEDGFAKINVMLVLGLENALIKSTVLENLHEAVVANYVTIFTVFPDNADDMIKIIDKKSKCSLTDDDKRFLRKIAESTKRTI